MDKKTDNALKELVSEWADQRNLVGLDKQDVEALLTLGEDVCLKPKKGRLAKGAIFYIKGNSSLTFDEINQIGEKLTEKHCAEDAKVIWGARIMDKQRKTEVVQVYVY